MTKLTKLIAAISIISATGWLAACTTLTGAGDALMLEWSVETGAPINQPPVVAANQVLVIPKDGPLIAFDASSGSQTWQFSPAQGVWSRGMGSDGKRVFVCLKGGGLAALQASDGTVLWKIDLGINCQRPPLVSGDTIFISTAFVGTDLPSTTFTGAKLFSINSADGRINWAFKSDNYILQVPSRFADTVYVGGNFRNLDVKIDEGGHNRFYALDAKTGQQKWASEETERGFPKALYATKERLVFVGYQDFLVALDTADGKRVWERDTGNWVPSLSGVGDVVYYGAANTKVHAWDVSDGKSRWLFNIPGGAFNYLMGKPVFVGDTMYFKSHKGMVYALDRQDGTEMWSYETAIETRTGLSVSDRSLYIGSSQGTLYAYKILK
jgi:outer membrane protein assembly factor BamB